MKKIFTLCLGVLFASGAFAQLERPATVIKKATVKPVIDGVFDDVWAETDSLSIERPFDNPNGLPTLGDPGETYWKALWDEEGFYLIVKVTDDNYWPNYLHPGGGNAWEYDKPEIYFDVNFELQDGKGPNAANSGHHQMAPDMTAAKENGMLNTEGNGRQHAFKVDAPNYVAEYFVPWASLTKSTAEGGTVNIEDPIGFDVSINDSDESNNLRRRGVWANVGPNATESWVNMDQAGIITLDGAVVVNVEEVNISADGGITEDNQQLQINVEVLPEDATAKSVKWIVSKADGTPIRASISSTGLITPVVDEVLIIQASSADDFVFSDEITVSITGQKVTIDEINYIKNGNFEVFDAATFVAGAPWTGGATVVDGVLNITNTNVIAPDATPNPWDWTVGQDVFIPASLKEEAFVFMAKIWAAEPRIFDVDFELIGDNYDRFGDTPDPRSADGKTQWRFELTNEPTMYTIDITNFTRMDTRTQKFNLFAGMATPTVYVDSIYLLNVNDMKLLSTAISQQRAMESFRVYPNPASSYLNVELSTINSRVAIYNSVGVKMDEAVVSGNRHSFDVSRYAKGLYFVKANGAVIKFIK